MFLWLPFLSYIFVVAYTPGPMNIMTMNNAANVGFRRGLIFNFGSLSGTIIVLLASMIFSSVLYAAIPKIQLPMKIIGAAYILFLAVKNLIPSKLDQPDNKSNNRFLAGFLFQLVNPKLIMYGITAMSSYILPCYTNIITLILFVLLLTVIQFSGNICWALFGSIFSMIFGKNGKIINAVMSVLLLYCAVSLFI